MLEVDVSSGERSTGIVPRSKLASAPPGVQSRVRPFEFVEVQAPPRLAPRSQVPVPGVLGVPLAEHRGQGCVPLPVMNVWELSATFREAAPVERLSVPLPGALNVFSTHVLRVGEEGFGIGSGVPKLQPVLVQSGCALLAAGAVDVAPMVQLEPTQASE